MSWSISTRTMKNIHSFEQAHDIWNKATPWRNEHESWRPLDGRRMVHKCLVKTHCGGVEGYACTLYSTALVTYFADGSVDLQTYGTVSSRMFARCMSPPKCHWVTQADQVYWRVTTDKGDHYYTQSQKPLHLTPTKSGNWRLTGTPEPRMEWVGDRRKMREVREQLKSYKTWFDVTTKLVGQPRYKSRWLHPTTLQRILAGDTETFTEAFNEGTDPASLHELAYTATGARFRQPVPFDRLPRNPA